MRSTLILAITLSAAAVAIGVFLPLLHFPLYGTVTYHRAAPVEAWIIVACAIAAPLLLWMRKPRLCPLAAAGVWATLCFPQIREALSRPPTGGDLGRSMADASAGTAQAAVDFFVEIGDFLWGGWVFFGGCLVFTVACLLALGLGGSARR